MPPGVALPEELSEAVGEQQDVLQKAATALDEMTMPFCLGVWNHTAMAWKEGRHAWVSSDGRVVCLNTDREPGWYEPIRAGFGGEPAQRMLAVIAATDAPDEMLEATPRAKVVRRSGARTRSIDLGAGGSRMWLYAVFAAVLLALGAAGYVFARVAFRPTDADPQAAAAVAGADEAAVDAPSGPADEAAACPFIAGEICGLLRPSHPGASVYCQHSLAESDAFAQLKDAPDKGPTCLRRSRNPNTLIQRFVDRQAQDDPKLKAIVAELTDTACDARTRRGCGPNDCPDVANDLKDRILDVFAKRFARDLHNRSADKAVPDLTRAMKYNIEDPKKKSAEAWLTKAMPVSCAWRIRTDADPRLGEFEAQIAQDFDRLRNKLPSHRTMVESLTGTPSN